MFGNFFLVENLTIEKIQFALDALLPPFGFMWFEGIYRAIGAI